MGDERSPWREPMVWLIVALPLSSIVAGFSLLAISVRSGSIDAVADPVVRTAQIQVSDLGPDERARQLGLSGVFRVGIGLIEFLPVTGDFDRGAPLRVAIGHPTLASADREVLLQPAEAGWRGAMGLEGAHDWRLTIMADDGRWRLRGRLPKGQLAARVQPAVGSP